MPSTFVYPYGYSVLWSVDGRPTVWSNAALLVALVLLLFHFIFRTLSLFRPFTQRPVSDDFVCGCVATRADVPWTGAHVRQAWVGYSVPVSSLLLLVALVVSLLATANLDAQLAADRIKCTSVRVFLVCCERRLCLRS